MPNQHQDGTGGMRFSDRFRGLLAEWGDCDLAVAELLGCDYRSIYLVQYENLQLPEIAVVRLAKRWGVTPEYLAGSPGAPKEPKRVSQAKARLRQYLIARESEFGPELVQAYRVRLVLCFLMKAVPTYFTGEFVARWVHLSLGTLNKILKHEEEIISGHTIYRTSLLSGIPVHWFWQLHADLREVDEEPALDCQQFCRVTGPFGFLPLD